MDKLSIGVLRELFVDESSLSFQSDVRRPYRDIAKKLHVTEDTVRSRIQKLQETGLIRGWKLGVNPTLFGYQAEYIQLDINPPSIKENVIQMVRRLPYAIAIQSFFDDSIGISLAYARREELDKQIRRIRHFANSHNLFTTKTPFLSCKLTSLTDTDWRIVKFISRDPRKPYGEIATELGLSRRTVKRRAQRMIGAHAFFILPQLDLKKLDGGVLANLAISYPPESKHKIEREVLARYGETLLVVHSTLPEYSWFAFIVPNLAVAKEIRMWASSSLEAVKMVDVKVTEEILNLLGENIEDVLG